MLITLPSEEGGGKNNFGDPDIDGRKYHIQIEHLKRDDTQKLAGFLNFQKFLILSKSVFIC